MQVMLPRALEKARPAARVCLRTAAGEKMIVMTIVVNGKPRPLTEPTTVAGLLRELQLPPVRVAVELNEELVARRRFEETPLREGDRVEVVTFVGGG